MCSYMCASGDGVHIFKTQWSGPYKYNNYCKPFVLASVEDIQARIYNITSNTTTITTTTTTTRLRYIPGYKLYTLVVVYKPFPRLRWRIKPSHTPSRPELYLVL